MTPTVNITIWLTCSHYIYFFFFFNDTATTEIYTLSLHDALPIWLEDDRVWAAHFSFLRSLFSAVVPADEIAAAGAGTTRSEEHTSELQSRENLVCRLLLEKKKKKKKNKK